jgi:hypothetical protein
MSSKLNVGELYNLHHKVLKGKEERQCRNPTELTLFQPFCRIVKYTAGQNGEVMFRVNAVE